MHPFEKYLRLYRLEALTVSGAAKVRYMTVYNATKGFAITSEHARKIRQAVLTMTGFAYTGPLELTKREPVEEMQTIPIKKITGK